MRNLFCCVQVDQSTVAIKETFGKFDEVLQPGCHYSSTHLVRVKTTPTDFFSFYLFHLLSFYLTGFHSPCFSFSIQCIAFNFSNSGRVHSTNERDAASKTTPSTCFHCIMELLKR